MAYSKPVNPKKKKRGRAVKDAPFPVPIATDQQGTNWFYYTGYLHDNDVEIKHSGDIDRLYRMGFFGKGTFSRSKPEFNTRFRSVQIPNSKGEIIHARVISRRSYLYRLNRKLHEEGKTGKYIDYDSDEELWENTEMHEKGDIPEKMSIDKMECKSFSTEIVHQSHKPVLSTEPGEVFKNLWETSSTGSNNELWEEDANFWNTDSRSEEENANKNADSRKWDSWQESSDFWSSNSKQDLIESNISRNKWNEHEYKIENIPQGKADNLHDSKGRLSFDKRDTISLNDKNSCMTYTPSAHKNETLSSKIETNDNQNDSVNENNLSKKDSAHSNLNSIIDTDLESGLCNKPLETDSITSVCISEDHNFVPPQNNSSLLKPKAEHSNDFSESDLDSLCKSDDDDGTLFVVDDSGSEVDNRKRQRVSRKKWRPVLKRDPSFVKESLHLSFEETFFLSYGLGCIVVKDENGGSPDLSELWQIMSRKQTTFIPNYIAYHYYRSKGWVPKTGLKFGTDFLIYKEGPAFYHGSYSVIVKMVSEETLKDDPHYPSRDMSWTSLAGLNRLTEQVAKEVLICYVLRPNCLTDNDLLSPKCIPHFTIKEVLLSRWISSQEREKQAEEIP